jgi:hypothetical protein
MTKSIDEHFFEDESRKSSYVLGAMYAGAMVNSRGLEFRSSELGIVRLVRKLMKGNQRILSDPRDKKSYCFRATSPYLGASLYMLGFAQPKSQRDFPRLEQNHSDFVRGFYDADAAMVQLSKGKSTGLRFTYNNRFLSGLHDLLVDYAGVQRHPPKGNVLEYGYRDAKKVHDFIYANHARFFVKKKKGKWHLGHPDNLPGSERDKRIERAKKLLLRKPTAFIADSLGYSSLRALYRAFKDSTGMTIQDYRLLQS